MISRVKNFVGFKHKKSSVFVGFTSLKPIKAFMFFCRFDRFSSVLNVRDVGFFVGFKRKRRRFSSVSNVRDVGFRQF